MKFIQIIGAEGTGHHVLRALLTDFYQLPEVDWWRYNRNDMTEETSNSLGRWWRFKKTPELDKGYYEDTWIIDEEKFHKRFIRGRENGVEIIVNDNSFPFLKPRNPLRRPDFIQMLSIAKTEADESFVIALYRDPIFAAWSGFRRGFTKNMLYQAQIVENSYIIINNLLTMLHNNGFKYFVLNFDDILHHSKKYIELLCGYLGLSTHFEKLIANNTDKLFVPKGPTTVSPKELEILTKYFTEERCQQWAMFRNSIQNSVR